MTDAKILAAKLKIEAKEANVAEMAALNGVHPMTITRSIKRLEASKKT